MSGLVSIDYKLSDHRWSSFTLTIGAKSIDVGPFDYCTDALGDLVRAALIIATSGGHAEVAFDGESRKWHLIIERALGQGCGPTDIRVAMTSWFSLEATNEGMQGSNHSVIAEQLAAPETDWKPVIIPLPFSPLSPPPDYIAIFDTVTQADTFALAVLHCAQRIRDEHGREGYPTRWGGPHGFPLRALAALKAAISVQETLSNWTPDGANDT